VSSIIDVRSLTKRYGKARGVDDVTLAIEPGEIFGFIGPNGAGKTTTIRTLLGFLRPTSGSAAIFDLDVVMRSREIKKQVGYLPADVNYYDDMRSGELLGLSARLHGVPAAGRIADLSAIFGLDLRARIRDLSTGNRKKVGIVQALLHEPDLLILDEPTSGLDPLVQHAFFELLRSEKERGRTIFFSSHVLSEVQRLCDRVALPRAADGRLMLAVDVSNWLRPDAVTSGDRLFCHVYGRGRSAAQMIPGWPYSFDLREFRKSEGRLPGTPGPPCVC
jgi:ABC-2 type transport system ATP-binding protein